MHHSMFGMSGLLNNTALALQEKKTYDQHSDISGSSNQNKSVVLFTGVSVWQQRRPLWPTLQIAAEEREMCQTGTLELSAVSASGYSLWAESQIVSFTVEETTLC